MKISTCYEYVRKMYQFKKSAVIATHVLFTNCTMHNAQPCILFQRVRGPARLTNESTSALRFDLRTRRLKNFYFLLHTKFELLEFNIIKNNLHLFAKIFVYKLINESAHFE